MTPETTEPSVARSPDEALFWSQEAAERSAQAARRAAFFAVAAWLVSLLTLLLTLWYDVKVFQQPAPATPAAQAGEIS